MKSVQSPQSLYALFQRTVSILFVMVLITAPAAAQESAQPSKKLLVDTLLKIVDQLEAEKYSETEKYFYLPEDFEHKMFAQLIKRDVISRKGVEALNLGGEYGNAIDVLKKSDAEATAAEFSAPVDQCFAMKMEQGDQRCKVIVHWTGGHFKILDISRVGKMDPDSVEVTVQSPVQSWPTGDHPTKELLIETLKVFLHNIQNKHYDSLRPNVYVPEDFQMSRFSDSLKRDELSEDGIKVLADKGAFGKADQVYPKLRAEALTKRVQVPVDESYGFVARIAGEQGEVLAHWIGDRYKLLRADDIGKLPAALKVEAKTAADKALSDTSKPEETSPMPTTAPAIATPTPSKVQPPSKSKGKPAVAVAKLPKYETDKNVVIANYQALSQSVAANPENVAQRARFVQSLLVIGNTPKAWSESVEIYRLDPQNIEVVYAIDQSIEALKKNGIFQVGVPQETIEALMGKPLKTEDVDGGTRWNYPNWNVDFNGGRFVKLSRAKAAAVAKPVADSKPSATVTAKSKPDEKRFGLKLMSFEKRVNAVHLIRIDKDLSLKESLKLIEKLPVVIFEGLTQSEAKSTKTRYAEKGLVTEIIDEVTSLTKDPAAPTTFNIELSSFGTNKIAVIKVIRELNKGMRLLKAKQLTENLPSIVLEGVSKEEATVAKEKFVAAGATVEIK